MAPPANTNNGLTEGDAQFLMFVLKAATGEFKPNYHTVAALAGLSDANTA